MSFQDQFSD